MRKMKIMIILTLLIGMLFPCGKVFADDELAVIKQPESAVVNYPDPVSFHVEVNRPEDVASYQWYVSDGDRVRKLDGLSATTHTLVLPSTQLSELRNYFECEITAKDGHRIWSDTATLDIGNQEEDLEVFYISDYAIRPGETLDLNETVNGSGTIVYQDKTHIIFNDVIFDNTLAVYDSAYREAIGMDFFDRLYETGSEYHFIFNGNNEIHNYYYDADENGGGIDLYLLFVPDGRPRPRVILEGEGSLLLQGGSMSIFTDAYLTIDIDLKTIPMEKHYNDAIRARDIIIGEGRTIDINCVGTGLRSYADLIAEDATIKVNGLAPHISVGTSASSLIETDGQVLLKNCTVDLHAHADPENFLPYGKVFGGYIGIRTEGGISLDNTDLTINMDADHAETQYANSFRAVVGNFYGEPVDFDIANGSNVTITIDDPDIYKSAGITFLRNISVTGGSILDVTTKTSDYSGAIGHFDTIPTPTSLYVKDSSVYVDAESYSDDVEFGIYVAKADINLSDCSHEVVSKVKTGYSILTFEAEGSLTLSGSSQVIVPENHFIDIFDYENPLGFYPAETIYDSEDPSLPVRSLTIRGEHEWGDWVTVTEPSQTQDGLRRRVCLNDPSHIEEEVIGKTGSELYYVASGSGSTWYKASSSPLSFTYKRTSDDELTFPNFTGLQIDGKDIAKENYTVSQGSAVISLSPDCLSSLKEGSHKLKAVFQDGDSQEATFYIKTQEQHNTYRMPLTGIE